MKHLQIPCLLTLLLSCGGDASSADDTGDPPLDTCDGMCVTTLAIAFEVPPTAYVLEIHIDELPLSGTYACDGGQLDDDATGPGHWASCEEERFVLSFEAPLHLPEVIAIGLDGEEPGPVTLELAEHEMCGTVCTSGYVLLAAGDGT